MDDEEILCATPAATCITLATTVESLAVGRGKRGVSDLDSLTTDMLIYALGAVVLVLTSFVAYILYKNIREYYEVKRLPVGPEYRDRIFREHPETGIDIQPIEPDGYCLRCGTAFPPGASTCPACGTGAGGLSSVKRVGKTGIIKHDLMVSDEVAFREGELVNIESMSLDPDGSEVEYIVISRMLDRSFHLSDDDLMT